MREPEKGMQPIDTMVKAKHSHPYLLINLFAYSFNMLITQIYIA